MKLIIILSLLAIFLLLLFIRLRPYIRIARQMFGIMRGVRGMSRSEVAQPLRAEAAAGNKLVRCSACGTWIPASRVVKLRSSLANYCSHDCLEASVAGVNKRKTAG
ncbi:MAG TPA: hypothetical protein VF528_06260 [Pyrinomonadaceae bacterium]